MIAEIGAFAAALIASAGEPLDASSLPTAPEPPMSIAWRTSAGRVRLPPGGKVK